MQEFVHDIIPFNGKGLKQTGVMKRKKVSKDKN